MIRIHRVLPVLVSVVLLGSCASIFQAPKDPWIGASKDQLVKQMGNPNSTASDSQGGEIWVYTKSTIIQGSSLGSTNPGSQGGEIQQWILDKFFIDANGIIYAHQEMQM